MRRRPDRRRGALHDVDHDPLGGGYVRAPFPSCALRTPCAWRVAHMRELWADRGLGACRILSIHKRWEHPVYSTFLAEIVGLSVL